MQQRKDMTYAKLVPKKPFHMLLMHLFCFPTMCFVHFAKCYVKGKFLLGVHQVMST
jgi:hypothetical protein